MRDWHYRFIDDDGVVHLEEVRMPNKALPGYRTRCGTNVRFGEQWDDDHRIIVTCMRCLGYR